jgi:hypothetical protein
MAKKPVKHLKVEHPTYDMMTLCGGVPMNRASLTQKREFVTCKRCLKKGK